MPAQGMSFTDFANEAPQAPFIKFLFDPSQYGNLVRAVNIPTTGCNGVNVFSALQTVETITFTINGVDYRSSIINRIQKSGYFSLSLEYFYVPNTDTVFDCSNVIFEPSVIDAGFITSDYNIILNNATENRLAHGTVFDVDRSNNQIRPTNYQSIIDGTARVANYQELNYTSVGLTRSRYEGSETNEEDYGLIPSISAGFFNGEISSVNTSFLYICSKSSDERDSEDLLFAQHEDYYSPRWLPSLLDRRAVTDISKPNVRYVPAWNQEYYPAAPTGLTLGVDDQIVSVSGSAINTVVPGDYLFLASVGSTYETVQVEDVSYANLVTTFTVKRRAIAANYGFPVPTGFTISPTDKYTVHHIVGDYVYGTDNNELFKVLEKIVYDEDTGNVFLVDKRGNIIHKIFSCSD